MEYVIQGRSPRKLYDFFEQISAIPRGSRNEKEISEYLLAFAAERGLRVWRDDIYNVIIWKDGQNGGECQKPVLLECHTDIVCAKTPDSTHDFLHDPIRLIQEGNILHADRTTLGADNGCGVATILYILDSKDFPHPPLECYFASQEEIGLIGASNIDVSKFKARRAIGLDAGTDGVLCEGASSKYTYELCHAAQWEENHNQSWTLTVSGLMGGHAALWMPMDRQNAARLAGMALNTIRMHTDLRLCRMEGSDKGIMQQFQANFVTMLSEKDLYREVNEIEMHLQHEFRDVEPELRLHLEKADDRKTLKKECSDQLIDLLLYLPYGVYSRNPDAPKLVGSYANLTKVHLENGADEAELECVFSVELPEKERSLYANLKRCLQIFGGRVSSHSVSEGWTPSEVSPIREKMVEAFVQLYGRKPFIKVSHGGNDCVKLVQRIPNLDAVTCAADCINHHTPREYLPMDTFERMLALVVRTLQLLAEEEDV